MCVPSLHQLLLCVRAEGAESCLMAWLRPLRSNCASSVSPNISSHFLRPLSRFVQCVSLFCLRCSLLPSCSVLVFHLSPSADLLFLPSPAQRVSLSLHVSPMRTLHRLKLMSSPSLSELGKSEKSSPEDRGEKQKRAGANATWNR